MVHTTFERLPEEKRNRILQAARAESIRYPYEKTSINRILAEAEVPKGSFYQYFDDKSDLFSCCICDVYKKLIPLIGLLHPIQLQKEHLFLDSNL